MALFQCHVPMPLLAQKLHLHSGIGSVRVRCATGPIHHSSSEFVMGAPGISRGDSVGLVLVLCIDGMYMARLGLKISRVSTIAVAS